MADEDEKAVTFLEGTPFAPGPKLFVFRFQDVQNGDPVLRCITCFALVMLPVVSVCSQRDGACADQACHCFPRREWGRSSPPSQEKLQKPRYLAAQPVNSTREN